MAAAGPRDFRVENMRKLFECPVDLTPYTKANPPVSLTNTVDGRVQFVCRHTVGKAVVARLERACPLCRASFTGYVENLALLQVVNEFFGHVEQPPVELPTASAEVPVAACSAIASIPFPGERAHFELFRGWEQPSEGCRPLVRHMEFKRLNPNATFSGFNVCGYEGGKIGISLQWNKDLARQMKDYFLRCGIELGSCEAEMCFEFFSSPRHVDTVFQILALHNHIPEPHFTFIRNLVREKDWRRVPS